MARMGNKRIALCYAAIGIVYAAGYVVSETNGPAQTEQIAAPSPLGESGSGSAADPAQSKPSGAAQAQSRKSGGPSEPAVRREDAGASAEAGSADDSSPNASDDSGSASGRGGDSVGVGAGESGAGESGAGGAGNTSGGSLNPGAGNGAESAQGGGNQAAAASKYHDGIYTGTGTNRFGYVTVAVTIKKGVITDVQITDCRTRYPEQYIASLPQEVIQVQSEYIYGVSGATRSSEDFAMAVHQALLKAEA